MNPWEMDWTAAKESVGKTIDSAVETVKNLMPWQMDWSGKKEQPPAKQPETPKQNNFEQIFNKLINAESGGKHLDDSGKLVRSKVGAEGITQLMPETAKKPGYGIEPVKDKSEAEYIRVGKEYLQKMYEKFGDWEKALAAYNAGVGNVTKAVGKAERFGGDWKDHLPKKTETLPYIQKILGKDKPDIVGGVSDAFNKVSAVSKGIGEFVGSKTLEATGSPLAATAIDTTTQLVADPLNLIPFGKFAGGAAGIMKVLGGKRITEVLSDASFAHIMADITGKPETIKETLKMGTLSADKREELLTNALKERTVKVKEK